MSYYTKFADVESVLTGTSTTALSGTDAVLIFSQGDQRYRQTTVSNIAAGGAVATPATGSMWGTAVGTSTNLNGLGLFGTLNPFGPSVITAAATGGVAILPQPPYAGIVKTISLGTSTTTGFQVISVSSLVAMYTTGTSSNTVVPRLQVLLAENGTAVTLTSISTTAWQVTFQSASPGVVFSTTTAT